MYVSVEIFLRPKHSEKSSKTPGIGVQRTGKLVVCVTKERAECVRRSRRNAAVSNLLPGGGPTVDCLHVIGKLQWRV